MVRLSTSYNNINNIFEEVIKLSGTSEETKHFHIGIRDLKKARKHKEDMEEASRSKEKLDHAKKTIERLEDSNKEFLKTIKIGENRSGFENLEKAIGEAKKLRFDVLFSLITLDKAGPYEIIENLPNRTKEEQPNITACLQELKDLSYVTKEDNGYRLKKEFKEYAKKGLWDFLNNYNLKQLIE